MIGSVWKLTIAQEDGVTQLPSYEAVPVVIMAFVLGIVAARYLNAKGQQIISRGELAKLKWIYRGTGQAAVFLAVFLTIVTAYIVLRLTPGT